MSKNGLIVDINNNYLTINGVSMVDLNTLFKNFINSSSIKDQFRNFEELNIAINRGDSVKDGTNEAILNNLNLFPANMNLTSLKAMAHAVISKNTTDGKIIRQVFTRDKKKDDNVKKHYQGLNFNIGFDAGLGLDNYLENNQYDITENFGKYIDPSTFRFSNNAFPSQGKSLAISREVFNILGYSNSFINNATCIGKDKYNYDITLTGYGMKNNDKDRKQDTNISSLFVGNKNKKSIISSQVNPDFKRASIIGKSLGDKLQVFLMFLKKILEKNDTIKCISTCDEIVLLFSIILELPCFYTSIGIENGVKINEILYFNNDNINPKKAMIRFNNEKKIVISKYNEFVILIKKIQSFDADIYVSGDESKTFKFTSEFYSGLIEDLIQIRMNVNSIFPAPENDINAINTSIDIIKKLTPNFFIKKGNDNNYMLIRSSAKYNNYIPLNANSSSWFNKYNLMTHLGVGQTTDYRSATFAYIAARFALKVNPVNPLASKKRNIRETYGGKITGGNMVGGGESSFFNTDPIIVYIKEDMCLDETCNSVFGFPIFDANFALYRELMELYKFNQISIPFSDIYSEMLCRFNFYPVYNSESLQRMMIIVNSELLSFLEEDMRLSQSFIPRPLPSSLSSSYELPLPKAMRVYGGNKKKSYAKKSYKKKRLTKLIKKTRKNKN